MTLSVSFVPTMKMKTMSILAAFLVVFLVAGRKFPDQNGRKFPDQNVAGRKFPDHFAMQAGRTTGPAAAPTSTPWPGLELLHLLARKATSAGYLSLLSYLESAYTCKTGSVEWSKEFCSGAGCKILLWNGDSCDGNGNSKKSNVSKKSLKILIQPHTSPYEEPAQNFINSQNSPLHTNPALYISFHHNDSLNDDNNKSGTDKSGTGFYHSVRLPISFEELKEAASIFHAYAANAWPGLAILRSAALASPPRLASSVTVERIGWREDWLSIARTCLGWQVSNETYMRTPAEAGQEVIMQDKLPTTQVWEGTLCWDDRADKKKIVVDMRAILSEHSAAAGNLLSEHSTAAGNPAGSIFEKYEIDRHANLDSKKSGSFFSTALQNVQPSFFSTALQNVQPWEKKCLFGSFCPWPGLNILRKYYEEEKKDADEKEKKDAANLMLNYLGAAETCPAATSSAFESDTSHGYRKVQWEAEGCLHENDTNHGRGKMEMNIVERENLNSGEIDYRREMNSVYDYALEHSESPSKVFPLNQKKITDIENKVGYKLFQEWNPKIVSDSFPRVES